MTTFQPGDHLGRYRIERPLGHGAMGDVYLGTDPQIDRPLALKTLRLVGVAPSELEERKERLLREARTAGRLIHPHIVTLFDAGEQDGVLFLAFEYVPGSDLGRRLTAGPLPVGEALRIAREACEGLSHAHRHGVVHRDVKPSNLMLDGEGRVKIADFGIAKMQGQGTELTVTGSVMGSPHYLSPEQVRGEGLDGRSDLFSLGIVLYEALAGRRPFQGETISTLVYQILGTEPPALGRLRPGLEGLPELLGRFLVKDREGRIADARTAADAVASLERSLTADLLSGPALADAAPTDATVVMPGTGTGTGTGSGDRPAVPPPPPAAAVPPPPPPPAAGHDAAAPTPLPPTSPEEPASAGVSKGGVQHGTSGAGGKPGTGGAAATAATGGTYAVPGLPGRRRGPLVAAVLAAVLLAAAALGGYLFLGRGADARQDGGEELAEGLAEGLGTPLDEGTTESGEESGSATGAGATGAAEVAGRPPRQGATTSSGVPSQTSRNAAGGTVSGPGDRPSASGSRSGTSGGSDGPTSTDTAGTAGGTQTGSGSVGVPAASTRDTSTRDTGTRDTSTRDTGTRDTGAAVPPAGGTVNGGTSGNPGSGSEGGSEGDVAPGGSSGSRLPPAEASPAGRRDRSPAGSGSGSGRNAEPPADASVTSGLQLAFEVFPPDAFVLVNGTVVGRAAEYGRAVRKTYTLPNPGTHRVTFRRDGMEDYHVQVEASRAGVGVTPVRARLKPLKATEIPWHELEMHRVGRAIAFKIDHPNARVLVDDQPVGLARQYGGGRFNRDGWLELPLGQHRVSLIAPGRQRVDFAVDVSSGATEERKRIDVVLPPLAAGEEP